MNEIEEETKKHRKEAIEAFSDFVESALETQICCELKQRLDKWYEFYAKDPEKRVLYFKSLRGCAKSDLLIFLPLLLEMYEGYRIDLSPDELSEKEVEDE